MQRLLAWLFPIRMGALTVPAHEHEYRFGNRVGDYAFAWHCDCGSVIYGFDPALPLARLSA